MKTIAQQLKITKFPFEINDNGDLIYYEDSDKFWFKQKYDNKGNKIYYEESDGFWFKKEYDDRGNVIYYESSNDELKQPTLTQKEIIGEIIGDREVLTPQVPLTHKTNNYGTN